MSFDDDKKRFLEEFGDDYGYRNGARDIDEMRETEFKRLKDVVYLDHAGATLYSESQLEAVFKDLSSTLHGNPHSQSDCSSVTTDMVAEARREVLRYFNASPGEYSVIFTSGATAALKLVGETFPWSCQSKFMYTMENHNSVLGIREYALGKGASALAVDVQETADHGQSKSAIQIIPHKQQRRVDGGLNAEHPAGDACNLFAFPSECNFSGLRFNLDLVNLIKGNSCEVLEGSTNPRGSWMVLIDAAKGCATEPPDLSKYKADFVTLSFYKIFGYPTGLGALIVKNDAAKLLKKTYFSGGTVAASIADIDFVRRRENIEELFEDGTLSYLSITSILHGFKIIRSLSMPAISRHTTTLATYVRKSLSAMRHENSNHVCSIYGTEKVPFERIGPIVAFNLRRPDGSWFGYREVEKLASLSGIQLRTGCFCNPGACAKYLGLSHSDLLSNLEAGHVCWDDHDVLNGKPTGAVRVSFGYMSNFEDVKKFLGFIEMSFGSLHSPPRCPNPLRPGTTHPSVEGNDRIGERYFLKSISIYPIKSCMGFNAESWPLISTGLLHDREWLLKSPGGEILTQKKVPEMSYISTFIDLNLGILFVQSPRCRDKLHIELRSDLFVGRKDEVDIHSQRFEVLGYDNEIDTWFSNALGRPCTLLRSSGPQCHGCVDSNLIPGLCRDFTTKMNFANEAQFLLISEESVIDLNNRLSSKLQKGGRLAHIDALRFRPNLVVSGGKAYDEDGWKSVRIGAKRFTSLGGCNRCQMINLSFEGGVVQRSNEPLSTLAAYRRTKGKILFGVLLRYEDGGKESDAWLRVGDEMSAYAD